jgi:hypothetical protein
MDQDDRKMFAPIFRGPARSPEAEVYAVLGTFGAGATAAVLAGDLLRSGLAVGLKAPVTRRVAELLDELERAARIERIPDGRYRVVRDRRAT